MSCACALFTDVRSIINGCSFNYKSDNSISLFIPEKLGHVLRYLHILLADTILIIVYWQNDIILLLFAQEMLQRFLDEPMYFFGVFPIQCNVLCYYKCIMYITMLLRKIQLEVHGRYSETAPQ